MNSKILKLATGKLSFSTIFGVLIFYYHHRLSLPLFQMPSLELDLFLLELTLPNLFSQFKNAYLALSFAGIWLGLFVTYSLLFEMYLKQPAKAKIQEVVVKKPPFPWNNEKLELVVGLVHQKNNLALVENPVWQVIPEKGIFQNIAVVGSIGSGKTAAVLYPLTKQAMFYQCHNQKLKAGMLVLDVKGNYYKEVLKFAAQCGREDDIVLIELGGKNKYNPIHKPKMEVIDIAYRVRTVLELFSGGGNKKDAFWDTKAGQMMAECLRLLRLTRGYATLADVHNLVTNKNFLDELLVDLEEIWQTNPHKISPFDYNFCTNYFRGEFVSGAKNTIETVKACVTEMTGLFAASEAVSQTFCPAEAELNFSGFADVINSGKIVVLQMTSAEQPQIAPTIAAFMKLDFQAEVRQRTGGKGLNTTRPVFFICDEYQEFITSNDGDFYGVSREARCCSLVASQSYTSLVSKLGDEKKFNTLQQNMLNKIWLRTDDKLTIETAQMLTGKESKAQYSKNISESAGDSKRSLLVGKLVADKASISESLGISTKEDFVFETKVFTQTLEMFKAVAFLSDGSKMLPPTVVHLLPYFEEEIAGLQVTEADFAKISFAKVAAKASKADGMGAEKICTSDVTANEINHFIIEETQFKETQFKEAQIKQKEFNDHIKDYIMEDE